MKTFIIAITIAICATAIVTAIVFYSIFSLMAIISAIKDEDIFGIPNRLINILIATNSSIATLLILWAWGII